MHPAARGKVLMRLGKAAVPAVVAFIPSHPTDRPWGAAGVGVAVYPYWHMYGAEGPLSRPTAGGGLTNYSKK